MQKIATYLMYFPRLYITCLKLLSKLLGRERGRTYYNNIQIVSFSLQKVDKKNQQYALE